MTARPRSIDELARATGVPVPAIRRYAALGLVPRPGPRAFADGDRLRLIAIHQLRELAVPVADLRQVVARRSATRDLLALHLAALEHDRARAARAAAAVRAALADPPVDLRTLGHRLDVLGRASALEHRDRLLATVRGIARPDPLHTSVLEAALRDLPDELSAAQWTALAELVELLADRGLVARIDGADGSWGALEGRFAPASWRQQLDDLVDQAHGAWVRHDPPDGRRGRVLATRWVNHAASLGRVSMHAAATDLLARAERQDPRVERVWELVATVRGWAGPPARSVAIRWLIEAVRVNLDHLKR